MRNKTGWRAGLLAVCLLLSAVGGSLTVRAEGLQGKKKKAEETRQFLTLSDIAAMNGMAEEDLNYSFGSGGHVSFLGHSFYEGTVQNEADARYSLEGVSELLGIRGVRLTFEKSYALPGESGTVYLFRQASVREDGSPAVIYKNMVKVLVDTEGRTMGLVSDIQPELASVYGDGEFISKKDAELLISNRTGSADQIHSEATALVYWTDDSFYGIDTPCRTVPAWAVFSNEGEGTNSLIYRVDIISALAVPESIVQTLGADVYQLAVCRSYSLDTAALLDTYSSEFAFRRMEDAGEYTYTADYSFAEASYPAFRQKKNLKVTVPVMRDTLTGLYTLGSLERKLMVTNQADFARNHEINPVVSENPEDPASWHFLNGTDRNGQPYAFDFRYVLGAYHTLLEADEAADDLLLSDADGVLPKLLTVYSCNGTYPADRVSFPAVFGFSGTEDDWAVIETSPADSSCVTLGAMLRELFLLTAQERGTVEPLGETGALTLGAADVLAVLSDEAFDSELQGDPRWQIGGRYSPAVCHLADPISVSKPRFSDDCFYMGHYPDAFTDYMRSHSPEVNSGVAEYLAYLLLETPEEELAAGEALLTSKDLRKTFMIFLDLLTGSIDCADTGHLLPFAARKAGCSEEQVIFLERLLREYGFSDSGEVTAAVPAVTDNVTLHFTLETDNEEYPKQHELALSLMTDGRPVYGGMLTETDELEVEIRDCQAIIPTLTIYDNQAESGTELQLYGADRAGYVEQFTVHMYEVVLQPGNIFGVPAGFTVVGVDRPETETGRQLMANCPAPIEGGSEYYVSAFQNGGTYGEIFIYHVTAPWGEE